MLERERDYGVGEPVCRWCIRRRSQKQHFLSHLILRTPIDPIRAARYVALTVQMSAIRKVARMTLDFRNHEIRRRDTF